jgi:hypothetical protein
MLIPQDLLARGQRCLHFSDLWRRLGSDLLRRSEAARLASAEALEQSRVLLAKIESGDASQIPRWERQSVLVDRLIARSQRLTAWAGRASVRAEEAGLEAQGWYREITA